MFSLSPLRVAIARAFARAFGFEVVSCSLVWFRIGIHTIIMGEGGYGEGGGGERRLYLLRGGGGSWMRDSSKVQLKKIRKVHLKYRDRRTN